MSPPKQFASHADTQQERVTFEQLSRHAWAYTAEGDPNTGIAIGDQVLDLNRAAGAAVWPADLRPLLAPLAEGSAAPCCPRHAETPGMEASHV